MFIKRVLNSVVFQWLRRVQFFVAIGVYLLFALLPHPPAADVAPDKFLHFLGNILLYASSYVAWGDKYKSGILWVLLVPFCVAVEGFQAFTPNRVVDGKDLLANVLGLAVGFCGVQLCLWGGRKWGLCAYPYPGGK